MVQYKKPLTYQIIKCININIVTINLIITVDKFINSNRININNKIHINHNSIRIIDPNLRDTPNINSLSNSTNSTINKITDKIILILIIQVIIYKHNIHELMNIIMVRAIMITVNLQQTQQVTNSKTLLISVVHKGNKSIKLILILKFQQIQKS